MKYYLIYHDNEFLGYSDNKELLKRFINSRNKKFDICKVDEKDISEDIKSLTVFDDYHLVEYYDYHVSNDVVLFEYEIMILEENIKTDALFMQVLIRKIIKSSQYLKLTKEEKKLIRYIFSKMYDDLSSITDSNEIIYDEVFDINKYFYKDH